MTRFILLIVVSTFFTSITKAQKADALIGKWEFTDLYDKTGIDSAAVDFVKKLFEGMSIYFKENNHYKAFIMGSTEEGSWSYDEAAKNVELISTKGSASTLGIIDLKNETLVISIDDAKLVLKSVAKTTDDDNEEALPNLELVSATKADISKKWYFQKREVPGKTKEQVELVSDLFKGTYMDIKSNNKFETHVIGIKEKGTWNFGTDNKSIILTVEDGKKIWSIKSISKTELVLIKGQSNEVWTLSTAE